jgi:hypothetical protein
MEYRSSIYNPLYRQIAKIRDSDISDYFSPALRRRVDGLIPGQNKKGNLILYSLGKTRYAVFGELKEKQNAIPYDEIKKVSSPDMDLSIFPPESETFKSDINNAKYFMIVKDKVLGNYALYYDEILDIREIDKEHVEKNIFPLKRPHPNVPGRIKIQGITYCLIRPWVSPYLKSKKTQQI